MTPEKFQSEGVLIQLVCKQWEGRAQLEKEKMKGLPKEIVRGRHELLVNRDTLKEISAIKRRAKTLLEYCALPFPIDSVYWVKKESVVLIEQDLQDIKTDFDNQVNLFIEGFQKEKRAFRKQYPEFYRPEKYPSVDCLKEKFRLDWRFFQMTLPDAGFGILSPEQMKRETEKLKGVVKEMEQMTVNMIGNLLYKRIFKLKKQFNNDRVNASTVESIEVFFHRWDDLWAGHIDEKKLTKVMDGLRANMKGVSVEQLKTDKEVMQELNDVIEETMEDIKAIPDFKLAPRFDI